MRTMKLWRITFALLAAFSLASCDKDDPFVETDSGKNIFGFLLNGKKVEYAWQPILPFTDYSEPVQALEYGNDTLRIYARLESIEELMGAEVITIDMPISKLTAGAVLDNVADIGLTYHAGAVQEGNVTHYHNRNLDIIKSRVSIRSCKPGEVLSGTFEFEGDAEFLDGTTRHCIITDGHFDVKWKR